MPFAWFTADEVYGQAEYLHAWLEDQDVSYVLAIKRNDTLTTSEGEQRADELITAMPGFGAAAVRGRHGPREFHWARVPVATRPRAAAGTGCSPPLDQRPH